MGTRLIDRGLRLDHDDPCLWNLARPEIVAEIHSLAIASGADALLTNTFGANRCWLSRFGREAEIAALNARAVAIARESAGPERFVIGALGPTAAGSPIACREQAEALAEAGVDALVLETFGFSEAIKALEVVRPFVRLPLIVSLWEWPEELEPSVRRLEDLGASVVGGNCRVGLRSYREVTRQLSEVTRLPIWVKASGSAPGEPPLSVVEFAEPVPDLLARNVRFLGGCCGTTEAHVAALRAACYAAEG